MGTEDNYDGRIAVIGMAGRFPGSPDIGAFWEHLRDGVEAVQFFSEDELIAAGESLDNIRDPAYVPASAPLDDIDLFDAGFFGMSPRDAAVFDPQHRLFLESAWQAFEHAGYVGEQVDGSVAVFASCGLSEYMFKNVLANEQVATSIGEWLVRHTGNDTNFLATRVSYELNLRGPSMNVQTACSSTLVAIHLACQSLLSGECDMALAGGAVVAPVQRRGYFYKEGEILSPDGHCRAFDEKSAGTIISSAVGCVLLKPLDAAIADGDNVLAVIRGSAINNDGNEKVGYLAPSVPGQSRVVAEALAVADVDARDVTYVEAHGTGTLIGDPIEIAGITQAYRQSTEDTQYCGIGSLKSNIGHTGEAAGVAAFIKTVLALQHRQLPPSLHYQSPNPQADFPHSPFFVNAALRAWEPGPSGTRIAGITGLGAGGTNAHVIIEEPPPPAEASTPGRELQLITLSARSIESVDQAGAALAAHLRANPTIDLADVAYTRLVGRKHFDVRRAVVASSPIEAAQRLESGDPKTVSTHVGTSSTPSIVFLMPGGGAQYAGMGRDLYESEAVYRDAIDRCCAVAQPLIGSDLRTLLFPTGDVEEASRDLERPSVALPALFATEYAMAMLLESWGVSPDAMIGHSAGEYVAACLGGVITMEEGIALVATRGRLFETLPPGGMLSITLGEDEARAMLISGLSIAAVNAADLCVVSGPQPLIDEMEAKFTAADVDSMRVHINVAAHSSMLEPILAEFGAFCRTIGFRAPTKPYVSNLTGTWITADQATDPDYWVRHLREAVRFSDGMATIMSDPNRVLVEIGPGRTLASFARMAAPSSVVITPTMRHPREDFSDVAFALGAVGKVYTSGVSLDPEALHRDEVRHRIELPTYSFERQRFWVDPDPVGVRSSRSGPLRKKPDVADWFSAPSWRRSASPPASVLSEPHTWMIIDDGEPLAARMIDRLRSRGHRVIRVGFGEGFEGFDDEYIVNTEHGGDFIEVLESLRLRDVTVDRIVHMTALGRGRKIGRGRRPDLVPTLEASVDRDLGSLLELATGLVVHAVESRLIVITSDVHVVGSGERTVRPERALLHGACRVVPRELGHISSMTIDLDEQALAGGDALVDRLLADLAAPTSDDAGSADGVVAYRGMERWVRRFDPVVIGPTDASPWVDGGTYVITGGLGGIGLSVAEQIARSAKRARLVLLGRSAVPNHGPSVDAARLDAGSRQKVEALRRLEALGAEVMAVSVDITDAVRMAAVMESVRTRFGKVTGVIHSAGVLDDQLIAMRPRLPMSDVISVKAKGVLVIDQLLAKSPPELILLFSSVSSIIGLPGQVDYTAANAFLDSYAGMKNVEGVSRAVVVNWSAWQSVGMAVGAAHAEAVRHTPAAELAPDPARLIDHVDDRGNVVSMSTAFSRSTHWVIGEHQVDGGDTLLPGTGYVELMRQAGRHLAGSGTVELTDLVFLRPFFVGADEVRTLTVQLDRSDGSVVVYSDDAQSPHATGNVALRSDVVAKHVDIDEVRARCRQLVEEFDGFSAQPFMDFGAHWGNLRRVEYGVDEAVITTILPDEYVGELDSLWLHPAVLDMAIGSAQAIIPSFDQASTFYVPFGYGRIVARGPIPATAFSHVRIRPGRTQDIAVFDIGICDEQGNEVISVDGFTMRRIEADSAFRAGRADELAAPQRSTAPVQAAVREGIFPEEGVDALDRLLTAGVGGQVVVCSVDLDRWIQQVDSEARSDADDADLAGPQFARPNLRAEFAEPATAIERELATMWGELLGISQVGRDDDFFELGGQSLVAVRLFARLRRRFSFEMPLSTLFEAPTIALLAGLIGDPETDGAIDGSTDAAASTEPPERHRFLVPMHGARGGSEPPLFIVHGMFGNVVNFRFLASELAGGRKVYGIQAKGLYGGEVAHSRIDDAADDYLAEVRQVQPNGPYCFAGYSGGGLTAIEMARRMRAAGEVVADVILLDTWAPTPNGMTLIDRVRMQLGIARSRGSGYLREWVTAKIKYERERRKPVDPVVAARRQSMHNDTVAAGFFAASAAYQVSFYDGGMALFRPSPPETFAIGKGRRIDAHHRIIDEGNGWGPYCARLKVFEVAGDHATMIEPPNVAALASFIDDVLRASST